MLLNALSITSSQPPLPCLPQPPHTTITHHHHPHHHHHQTTTTTTTRPPPPHPTTISLRQAETLLCNLEAGLVNVAGPHADVSGLGMGPGPGPASGGGTRNHNSQNHSHNPSHNHSHQNLPSQALVPTGTSHGYGHGTSTPVLPAFPVLNLAHAHLSWTIKFEICRRKLVARKLQAVVRAFLNHSSVVIPRTVRGMLRSGYLRGVRGTRTRQVARRSSE